MAVKWVLRNKGGAAVLWEVCAPQKICHSYKPVHFDDFVTAKPTLFQPNMIHSALSFLINFTTKMIVSSTVKLLHLTFRAGPQSTDIRGRGKNGCNLLLYLTTISNNQTCF